MKKLSTGSITNRKKITKKEEVDWSIELRKNNECMSEYTLAERKNEVTRKQIRRECDLVSMERKEACDNRERICTEREGACEGNAKREKK